MGPQIRATVTSFVLLQRAVASRTHHVSLREFLNIWCAPCVKYVPFRIPMSACTSQQGRRLWDTWTAARVCAPHILTHFQTLSQESQSVEFSEVQSSFSFSDFLCFALT